MSSEGTEKEVSQDLVLDLASFQLIRAGKRLELQKTPLELLTLLVRKRGKLVTREEIITSIWGEAVHIDVDAGINTAIRKIRQALDDDSSSPRYLETVVGKGYRFVGPITLVGSNNDVTAASASSAPRAPHAHWVTATLIVVGLATLVLITLSAIRRHNLRVSADLHSRVLIAVVPLENLSEDSGQDYFVDGLTDEILTQLGQLNPARLGVVRYGPSPTIRQTGSTIAELDRSGLKYLLEGSVRRDHEQARISIRLVSVADESTIWTDSFDRRVGDVLALQSEIARRIGRELQVQVLGPANSKPVAAEVVEAYLRGRFEMIHSQTIRNGPSDATRAFFERAIALDPSYAPAQAGLADFYRSRAIGNDEGAESAWRLAEQYATQALSLDSESAETHSAIAEIKLMHDWDWHAAREHALRALQLNPSSPEAHAIYARYLRTAGKIAEAVNQRKQAVALDPFRPDLKVQLTIERYFARDYQGNVASARQALVSDPNDQSAHDDLCNNLGPLGLFDESITECGKALVLEGHSDWAAAYMREYREHGYEAASLLVARKDLDEVLKRPRPDLWDLANAYILAGRWEEALHTLSQGLQTHEPGLLQIRVDPDFDAIRNDLRYIELVRQIGFPTE